MMYPVISLSYPLQTNLCQPCSHLILIQYCLENLEIKTTCYPTVSCCINIFLSLKWPETQEIRKWYFILEDIFFFQSVGVRQTMSHQSFCIERGPGLREVSSATFLLCDWWWILINNLLESNNQRLIIPVSFFLFQLMIKLLLSTRQFPKLQITVEFYDW